MRNLLRDLALILKAIVGAGAAFVVPGVTPYHLILLLVIATIIKDLGDGFYLRVESLLGTLKSTTLSKAQISPSGESASSLPAAHQARMVAIAACALLVFSLSGCNDASAPTPATEPLTGNFQPAAPKVAAPSAAQVAASLNSYAFTVANVLQTQNTSTGQTLQTTAVNDGLQLAGASPKTQAQAAIVNSLTSLVGSVIIAAHNAGAPPAAIQSTVNGALTPTAVSATAQAAVTNASL